MIDVLLPEVSALTGLLILFFLSLSDNLSDALARRVTLIWSLVTVVCSFIALDQTGLLFSESYRIDSYSQLFKLIIAVGLFFNALLGWPLRSIPEEQRTEYYLFFFSAGLGMMLLASVFNFLVLYLAMELVAYSVYAMVGMRRDRTESIESAVKYFLVGAVSSAVGLYGLSLIYGAAQGLTFGALVEALRQGTVEPRLLIPGVVMVFSSFLFKLAAFPFHVWAPDAYDGAASPVAMFLASVSKLAGIAALFRIVYLLHPFLPRLETALGVIAILTMSYGNFVAFRQKSAKRLFAYSSIAQAGYILLGMIGFAASSPQAVMFYSIVYLLMNLVLFLVTLALEESRADPEISSFAGLYKRNALLAFSLMVSLFSLAGVPPLSGFFGKWLLFSSAAEQGHIWLVVLAILNSVISLYYYLFVVKAAYFGDPDKKYSPLPSTFTARSAAFVLSVAIAMLGLFPRPLFDFLTSLNLAQALAP
ncbi:NADH-quinone oxidoreductase subunit N [bacterium]|nr:NADH-quinone oxidoreductase subunit N [bacterium]